jgi:hypothetical protein
MKIVKKGKNIPKYNEGGSIGKKKKNTKSTTAAQEDKQRRVEEGSVIRKQDYDLTTKAGQDAFKRDQAKSRENRRKQKSEQLEERRQTNQAVKSGTISKGEARDVVSSQREDEKARAEMLDKDTASKKSKADRTKDTENTTFVIGGGSGVKVKKTTATKKAQTTGKEAQGIKKKKQKAVRIGKTNKSEIL